jgi:uncharacterized protein (TIGR00369 family)
MSTRERPPLPENAVESLNALRGGFNMSLGLVFTMVTYDEVVAELEVDERHHQPYGLVHGGVYAAMIETLASAGAAVNAMVDGHNTVGLENSTSFLRGVREGVLTATAVPLTRGRRTHVWQVTITDDTGKTAAVGRVRMLSLAPDSAIAGETVGVKS